MPATQRGIYHNLRESKYTISNTEIVFFFSSKFYLHKFLDGYQQNRVKFLHKMAKITVKNPLNMETLADISFYQSIEKRGFRAWLKGVDITCNELYTYVLRKMITENTLDWKEIQEPKLNERLKMMS